MDIQTFQSKLVEICQLAAGNGNMLTAGQVKSCFGDLKPDREQLIEILKYLKLQGISIEGMDEETQDSREAEEKQQAALKELTPEEETYFKEYLDSLGKAGFDEKLAKQWFKELERGAEGAREKLVELYLPVAAEIARNLYCEGIHLADMIQEANVSLLSAFQMEGPAAKDDAWLRKEIENGLRLVLEEQSRQKFQDDCLVEKVERLEQTIRELTDDEDEGSAAGKFSVEDLSILLDMTVEEIEDVLKLTGGI